MQIYDTKSKKKEEFVPLIDGKVSMYVCGPTVYDVAHLGHGRSAVAFDVIRKYFEYRGFDVKFVSNYTDIDDKMIKRAKADGISVSELADKIIPEYEKDYAALGVARADVQPRATENIDAVLEIIGKLDEGGYIYVIDGDGVYFDVTKFSEYGELSGQNLEDLRMGARVEVNEAKRNPYDFALWKFKKEGEPAWESPWGEGRPGWHIECSAMSYKHLGREFDIHGGGLDLLFPHHECEVAQSVCALGEGAFAKYWIHNGFINVDNEKMSKSLGNFSTLKEIFERYDPQVVRFMFLQTHYRNPINFSDELLEQAKAALVTLHGFVKKLENYKSTSNEDPLQIEFEDLAGESMDDDFNTSGAFGTIFVAVKSVNQALEDKMINLDSAFILEQLKRLDKVFGVIFPTKKETKATIDEDIEKLIKEREEARKNKDFEASDRIRDELRERGIELEDTAEGTVWRKG
ncbi:MAG: cysteine--tRNA ligase [Nitrospirota bacterium]